MNLIANPVHEKRVIEMNARLFEVLEESKGTAMPLKPDRGYQFPWRHPDRAKQGMFPSRWFHETEPPRKPFP